MKIFVITHKKFNPVNIDGYIPLQVGAAINKLDLGYLKDNTGDNISLKNGSYCELTGTYWVWKNIKDEDIVGICHYRRYFSKDKVSINIKHFPKGYQIKKDLENNDIILQKKIDLKEKNVLEHFTNLCEKGEMLRKSDIGNTKKSIEKLYPDYIETFEKVINSNKLSFANMFITKKNIYDDYCNWLFTILSDVEEKLHLEKREGNAKRAIGYLGEFLLNVYVEKNNLKVKYYYIVNNDINKNKKYYIKNLFNKIKLYDPLMKIFGKE
jgi:hypothetical protein